MKLEIQCYTIAFVDDMSFYLNRKITKQNTEHIINKYTTLYEATGRLIEKNKL